MRATALYCIDLRSAVSVAAGDPARQKACEAIARALTSRINELTYATSRSPLQYGQLADVARWAAEFPFGDAAAEAAPPAPTMAASDPVAAHAARLAGSGGAYVHGGKKDVERRSVKVGPNQESDGSEASPPLPGYRFIRNPFDNTVVAVRPDGTGTQYTYEAVAAEGEVQLQLAHTVELSAQRVRTLARMDQAALGEKQEDEAGRKKRLANDQATGDQKRAEWAARSSDNAAKLAEYHQQLAEYNALSPEERKTRKPPVLPAGAPKNPTTTNCPNWCTPAYRAGGGDGAGFPFTPPKDSPAFYTLARRPEGPRPGDVYWLEFTAGGSTAPWVSSSRGRPPRACPGRRPGWSPTAARAATRASRSWSSGPAAPSIRARAGSATPPTPGNSPASATWRAGSTSRSTTAPSSPRPPRRTRAPAPRARGRGSVPVGGPDVASSPVERFDSGWW
ncbi:MAG: hypothetical protein HS111_08985 [Kofleriaceae bacterium]|nr:hypothetical protein [Kofleriaceae bacterium]